MPAAALPDDEIERLAALARFEILDSLPEQVFNDIVILASQICQTPIGLISLVDSDRQWFKARTGMDAEQTPRDQAFCAHAILHSDDVLLVEDATSDPRFADNPLVRFGPNLRFYAGAPIVTADGHALGTVCVIDTVPRTLDASQQRALQALARQTSALLQLREAGLAHEHSANQLKRQVTDALADDDRMHDGLRQRQRIAAVGQLTSGIAHDFNNLLQTINGSLQLIQRKASDRVQLDRLVASGLQAVASGAQLTQQLLAFSRTHQPEVGAIAVGDRIAGMSELLQRALGSEIRLLLDLQDGAAAVAGDPTQLEAAVLNLVINARDALSGVGCITISSCLVALRNEVDLKDGIYVELSVTDDGPGMATDVAARAFEPFFTTKASGRGTGLGLAQVYGFALKAGGIARIRSALGKGTTITLWLAQVAADAPATDSTPLEEIETSMTKETRILLVDDDARLREIIGELLEAAGYTVTVADGSLAALAAVEQQVPDLALIDCAMPSINGAGLARMLHVLQPQLPVIFITGYADTDALRPALGTDARVLQKPLLLEAVVQAIEAALGRRA